MEVQEYKPTFIKFISSEQGATFNLFFAHILFWALGLPSVIKHGYDNDFDDDDGNIPSGEKGSGVFPVSLIIVLVATIIWVYKLVRARPPVRPLPTGSRHPLLSPLRRARARAPAPCHSIVRQIRYFAFPSELELEERRSTMELEARRSSHKPARK